MSEEWVLNPVLKPFDIEHEALPCAQGKTVKKRGMYAENSALLSGIDEAGFEREERGPRLFGEADQAEV
jgi:hypothetical protein